MPISKRQWSRPFRKMRHHLTAKIFGRSGSFSWHLKRILSRGQSRFAASSSKTEEQTPIRRLSIPNFFDRKDQVHLALETNQLQWYASPPIIYHDLLLAAAKVGRVEDRIKYTFSDKMMCIEALKVTSSVTPLYFKGIVQKVDKNNRLALLGDRVLSLALCEIWFATGNSTGEYGIMFQTTETRAALYAKAHELGIHKEVLLYENPTPTNDQVAETFEAIIGAIYLDCGNNVDVVKRVITGIDLDTHKYLTTQTESRNLQEQKELVALRAAEQRVLRREATAAIARQALELRNETRKTGSLIKGKLQENATTAPVKTTSTTANPLNATPTNTAPPNATPTKAAPVNATPIKAAPTMADQGNQQDLPKSPVSDKGNAKDTPEPREEANHATSAVEAGSTIGENPIDDDSDIIAILSEGWKPKDMKSWTRTARGIKKHAWMVAIEKTKSLKRKGRPADTQALYETKLRKELKVAARRAQREELRVEERAAREARAAGKKQGPDTQVKKAPEDTEIVKAAPSILTQDTANLPEEQEPTSSSRSTRKESKKDKQERTKSVEELEREILESHVDAWKTTESGQLIRSSSSGTRHILQRGVEQAVEDVTPSSGEPSSEALPKEASQSKSQSQEVLEETDTQEKSVGELEIYESEVDRMLADITQDENEEKEATSSVEAPQIQDEAAPATKQNPGSQSDTKSNEETVTSSPEVIAESKPDQKAEAKS